MQGIVYNNKTIINNEEENYKHNLGNGSACPRRVLSICLQSRAGYSAGIPVHGRDNAGAEAHHKRADGRDTLHAQTAGTV